ncbi:MAG: hypothetical protein JST06_04110 [Bacteroidetes bacterium]|nr:hypothetical protein [Bacteroidota bacterium]MBS1628917.1 hypothetical protein [Bacteroidota bacterium]
MEPNENQALNTDNDMGEKARLTRQYLANLERELEKDEENLQQLQDNLKKMKKEIRKWLHILG